MSLKYSKITKQSSTNIRDDVQVIPNESLHPNHLIWFYPMNQHNLTSKLTVDFNRV